MAGDNNKIDTARLVAAAGELENIRRSISANVDSVNAVFRKMLDSNSGDSADELSAVAGQLKKSSADIITTVSHYETVLRELAGIYDSTEKKTGAAAGKLKFGGLR